MIHREPPVRNQHRYFALVASICIAKRSDQVSFLKKSSDDNPKSPESIKKQSIRGHGNLRPNHHKTKKVKRVPDPLVRPPYCKEGFFYGLALQVAHNFFNAQRIKRSQGTDGEIETDNREKKQSAHQPIRRSIQLNL